MIVIPAAGKGTRFREAGYDQPKHLIPLAGVTMIDRVIANVQGISPGPTLVLTEDEVGETRGTAETIVLGVPPAAGELLIANCDQLLGFPAYDWKRGDGVIFTFPSANPAHSYVITDQEDYIVEIVEKQPVSGRAVSGVYWFRNAAPIVNACREVLGEGDELYLSLALARLIEENFELYAVDAPTAILGTPEDFQRMEVAMSLCC